MEQRYELIKLGENIPIRLFLHRIGRVSSHWHKSLEMLLVLEGSVDIMMNSEIYTLHEDDIIVINSNTVHTLFAESCVMAAIQVDISRFDPAVTTGLRELKFECNSAPYDDKTQFNQLKCIIAQLLKCNGGTDRDVDMINKSLAYQLLYELVHFFQADVQENKTEKKERILEINDYIHQNFQKPVTLSDIAESVHISVPYLSRYFEKEMGMTPLQYINNIRLTYAMNDLLYTDKSIEEIALSNGFSNPRSYTTIFRKKYHMLPSQYRKQKCRTNNNLMNWEGGYDYLSFEQHSYLKKLMKYLPEQQIFQEKKRIVSNCWAQIDMKADGEKLEHRFLAFTSVGRAKEILYAPIQEMLRTIQKEIGFQYIKFHGILGDDMMLYSEDRGGQPVYDYVYVDMVIDFLLSIGLRPLIQLSFMPEKLSATPERTRFYAPCVMGKPKDWEKWEDMVKHLTQHFLDRYGEKEVEKWLFSPWNEPDTNVKMYGFEQAETFYELHYRSYRAVKSCDKKLRFGGASLQPLFHDSKENFGKKYFDWCRENNCPIEFVNINFYDLDFYDCEVGELWNQVAERKIRLSQDSDSFSKFIGKLRENLDEDGVGDLPIYLTEWNSTPSHSDYMNDTCFKSVYIVRNILKNFDRLNSFGYWVLSDLHEEYRLSDRMFHGGLGLFTASGIKKPGYYAYLLLAKLGREKIAEGEGYFVTRLGKNYRVMLYNYVHFSDLYAMGEVFDMTETERYTPFNGARAKEIHLIFDSLDERKYMIKETWVNRQSGSCFDKWIETGAASIITAEEIETLKALSVPMYKKYEINVCGGRYNFSTILEPLEIRLVEINSIGMGR